MNYHITDSALSERVRINNNVAKFFNKALKPVQDRLKQGYKIKDDGTLYAKDKTDVYAIMDQCKSMFKGHELQHTSIEYSYGQIGIRVKVRVSVNNICEYLTMYGAVYDNTNGVLKYDSNHMRVIESTPIKDLKQWPTFTVKQVQARSQKIADTDRKIQELKNKKQELRSGDIFQYLNSEYRK